jgi:hypothetical protein
LIEFDALEEGFEIPLPESLVSLALDDLKENRTDYILRKDLQQQALTFGRRTIHEDPALFEFGDTLLMALDALRK